MEGTSPGALFYITFSSYSCIFTLLQWQQWRIDLSTSPSGRGYSLIELNGARRHGPIGINTAPSVDRRRTGDHSCSQSTSRGTQGIVWRFDDLYIFLLTSFPSCYSPPPKKKGTIVDYWILINLLFRHSITPLLQARGHFILSVVLLDSEIHLELARKFFLSSLQPFAQKPANPFGMQTNSLPQPQLLFLGFSASAPITDGSTGQPMAIPCSGFAFGISLPIHPFTPSHHRGRVFPPLPARKANQTPRNTTRRHLR